MLEEVTFGNQKKKISRIHFVWVEAWAERCGRAFYGNALLSSVTGAVMEGGGA